MKKADLLRLPKLKIIKEIKEVAKSDTGKRSAGYGPYKRIVYEYKNYYRAKVFEDILKIVIYTRDDILREEPSCLIFISKEKNKFLTYDLHTEKWRTAKIDRLDSNWSYYEEKRYYTRGAEKTIIDYLDREEKTGYEAIYQFQSEIREDNLKRKHRRITDKIDSRMELVPELPKKFYDWIDKTAMAHTRYIYYEYSRKVTEGYCTHCKKIVKIKEKPKYNKEGICTECKSKITYKTEAMAGRVIDHGQASIFQKTREGFIYRYFEIIKDSTDYKNPISNTYEAIRVFLDENLKILDEYEFKEFNNTRVYRWCNRENKDNYYYYSNMGNVVYEKKSTLYTRNLKRIFSDTDYKYSAIEIFAKNTHQFYPLEYLKAYKKSKFIEYLVKAKLYRITNDYISRWKSGLNQYGKRIHDVLKVKKEQVKMLSEINPSIIDLATLQEANEKNVALTKEQFIKLANLNCDYLINYMHINTPHKIIRYVTEQNLNTKKGLNRTAHDYHDYLNMKQQLGEDLNNDFIFFPKNLKEAHDAAVEEINQRKEHIRDMKENEKDIELRKIAKENKYYEMKDKEFAICIPKTTKDLKEEGNKLHHCVATYVDRIISKESIVLFIREIKDISKPFFTLEIKHNDVKQLRGKYNCDPTPEVKAFVEKFKKKKLYHKPERKVV